MTEKRTGRIVRSISGFYDVQTPGGLVTCRGRGSLRKNQESPLTGDMVQITVENGKGMVEKTVLSVRRWPMWMRWWFLPPM